MKTLFIHDHVFKEFNGRYFSEGKLTDTTWSRYLVHSESLTVLARKKVLGIEEDHLELNETLSNNVNFQCIDAISIIDRIYSNGLNKTIASLIAEHEVIVCRLPSFLGLKALNIAKKMNKTVVLEIVGCPYDALMTHGSFIAKVIAPIEAYKMKRAVFKSKFVIYVTKFFLQERYPTNGSSINASNVELIKHDFRCNIKLKPKVIKFIGSLNAAYKGLLDIIIAVDILSKSGEKIELHILGSGDVDYYKEYIKNNNLNIEVKFQRPLKGGADILEWLSEGDIYVQPSHTEGLPRALIEAMSVGLPCIGSNVGGIPELLDAVALCPPKSPHRLARVLEQFFSDKNLREEQGYKNLESAKRYEIESLALRRKEFLQEVYGR